MGGETIAALLAEQRQPGDGGVLDGARLFLNGPEDLLSDGASPERLRLLYRTPDLKPPAQWWYCPVEALSAGSVNRRTRPRLDMGPQHRSS